MIWRCRCVWLHQSTGFGKWRVDIDVIVHIENILHMNSCSWFINETVCRGKLYNICGRSMLLTPGVARSYRLQRHGESEGWKWMISTIYVQNEYAYKLQETLWKAATIHGDLAYYMIMNADLQDYSISSLLLHNLIDSNSADSAENAKPKSNHLHEYCDVIWAHLYYQSGNWSPQHANGHLLCAVSHGCNVLSDCYQWVSYQLASKQNPLIDLQCHVDTLDACY